MNKYRFDASKYKYELIAIATELLNLSDLTQKNVDKILKKYPKDGREMFARDQIILGIEWLVNQNEKLLPGLTRERANSLTRKLKLKPTRTISGVTTVTVLTKPFACPGKCVFCPNDVRMPKSYIATEPGAQRALMNRFSPYLQTFNRLQALKNIGHPTDKIELLILGGTWSYYPEKYKVWFIKECFRAMNEFTSHESRASKTLLLSGEGGEQSEPDEAFPLPLGEEGERSEPGEGVAEQPINSVELNTYLSHDYNDELRSETGDKPYNQLIQTQKFKNDFNKFISSEDEIVKKSKEELWNELFNLQDENSKGSVRCVGLVLETRPDTLTPTETLNLRKLGATKIQLGIQTLDDSISDLNKRGEHRAETSRAFNLLREAGFKIHAHMMPNLYGATPELDLKVYKELFSDLNYKPDEVKIYPTSVIKNTELHKLQQDGKYRPYETNELVNLIADCMEATPEYTRLTRIIRDIPSTEIEAGNKTTNLREVVENKLKVEGRKNPNIRAREVRGQKLEASDLKLDIIVYKTVTSTEYFLQYITSKREIAGFLRLSIPVSKENEVTDELNNCAIIREVHVYGPSLELEKTSSGQAQHLGLGTKLIEKAKEITEENGFNKLAVISSIGTREYYDKRGFKLDKFYQICELF